MSNRSKLEEELKERLHTRKLVRNEDSSSGCISSGYCYTIDQDKCIFVKTNATAQAVGMFEGEQESLKQIRLTNTIRAPKPLTVMHYYDDDDDADIGQASSAFVMEYLNITKPLTTECATKLGHDLASLHDYNHKVVRFNKRASKWIGGNPPSIKALKQLKIDSARSNGEDSPFDSDDDKAQKNHDDDDDGEQEEENQFARHSMRVKGGSGSEQPASAVYTDRFVPEPESKEINQFGFDVPTSCGLIPQINHWTDDWVSFYARHRLDKAIRALLSEHGDRELTQQWSHLQLKVDKFFSDFETREKDKIVPALLHGDLWSGNVAQMIEPNTDGGGGAAGTSRWRPVIYDPSSFYGHSEYEFGIARMFGGLPREFELAYFELLPKRKLFEKRNKLYQLFHHLNHWEHFGSGYRASSLSLFTQLNNMVV